MDDSTLLRLLRTDLVHQDGVVSRRQLLERGAAVHDLERWVRRRLLARVRPGVLVGHTGPLTGPQRVWAAVLACGPDAAHCLVAHPGPLVHVAVDTTRRLATPQGVRVHRVLDLHDKARWSASPPRLLPEHDVLLAIDLTAQVDEVVRLLTDAVRGRTTTVARIRAAAAGRSRLRHRRLVLGVLEDVELGIHSVLEHRYLRDVERAHALPSATWQLRRTVSGRTEYADARYEAERVGVELDGRTGHEGWDAENRDGRRDLAQAAEGWLTVRLRSRQVLRDSCETARRLAALLRSRGWDGAPRPCGPGCGVIAEDPTYPVRRTLRDEAG